MTLAARLRFLGTGASGGTPGRGRSRRRESSLLVTADGFRLLIDVTRDFAAQASALDGLDAVLLTHGHRDASGGLAQLRRWWRDRGERSPIPVYAARETIAVARRRFARLDHCRFAAVAPGERVACGPWTVAALEVPHSSQLPTYAWRLERPGAALVYASDVARLTPQLERFARGARLLVVDGAMWGRAIPWHLAIDQALPALCGWDVERILVTQIGRTCPPHERLAREVSHLCDRAGPAHDGLDVALP